MKKEILAHRVFLVTISRTRTTSRCPSSQNQENMKVRLGEGKRKRWIPTCRRSGVLPLTPQTQELSPVKHHRYGRWRKRRRRRRRRAEEKEDSDSNSYVKRGETIERKENRVRDVMGRRGGISSESTVSQDQNVN